MQSDVDGLLHVSGVKFQHGRNSVVMDARIRVTDLEKEHETSQQSVQQARVGERHEQEVAEN